MIKINKVLLSLIFLLFLCRFSNASEQNIAFNKKVIGSFVSPEVVVDGDYKNFTTSRSLGSLPQFLIIDLQNLYYIERVDVIWKADALPTEYSIKISADEKDWIVFETKVDASSSRISNEATVTSTLCTGEAIGARYVQIFIPKGSLTKNPKSNFVEIGEIEVYPATSLKMAIIENKPYVVTDASAIITCKTNIGAQAGYVLYGEESDLLLNTAELDFTREKGAATLGSLRPETKYYYKLIITDFYGISVESETAEFTTLSQNIALGKEVKGTFDFFPPKDPYVSRIGNPLSRITDGSTSYFTGTATSRSIFLGDQYVIVNLGGLYSIENVITCWRKIAHPREFNVEVSRDGIDWNIMVTQNAEDGAISKSESGEPMIVVNAPLHGIIGRFIRIFIAKGSPFYSKVKDGNFVQLMELSVYTIYGK